MQRTKVLIVDDHALFRRGVRNIIECEQDMEVLGEARGAEAAMTLVTELKPDLVLMDIAMPGSDGLEAISTIKRALPGVKIIILTVHDQDEKMLEAIKKGVEGFLSKNVRVNMLLDSIRAVMKGEAAISGEMTRKVLKEYSRLARLDVGYSGDQLTPRERQVLYKIGEGLSNKEIACSLQIRENTVKVHVTHILAKLQVDNRFQAAAYARQLQSYQKDAMDSEAYGTTTVPQSQ